MPKRANIGSLFTKAAKHYPDALAIAQGDRELTYKEANERIDSLAKALKNIGVRKGDRIAVISPNCPEFIEIMFACFKMGAVIVPLNFRFVADEIVYHVNDPRCTVLIFTDEYVGTIRSITDRIPTVSHFICINNLPGSGFGSCDYEDLLEEHWTTEDQTVDVDKDDLAWLFYTSGTTGRPKGAMHTHGTLMAVIWTYLSDLVPAETRGSSAALHVGALSHGAGFHALAVVAKSAPNVLLESKSFDPELIAYTIEKYRITNIFMVPTMIKMFVESPEIDKYDLSSLKYVIYGGSPMYVQDLKYALKKIGTVFVQIFGQGESPMTGTFLPRDEHIVDGSERQLERLGSAGCPRTGIEIKLVDEEDNEIPAGEKGEVCIRGETVMLGYWERDEENEKTLKGGWLHTGDIGWSDEQGYLYIVDRTKDMYISGGSNVYPREVEEILMTHESVHQCVVVGVPDEKWGEAGKAVVVLKPGCSASEDELLDFCRGKMAGYKRPKSIDFVEFLPTSSYGKILKREVRHRYWAGHKRLVR